MKPERAREIAYQAWDNWMATDHDDHVADALTKAILQACAEQREADIKAMRDEMLSGIDNIVALERAIRRQY